MRSTSRQDLSEIFLEFGWDREVSAKGIEARAKVDAIRGDLPSDVERILIFTGSFGDQPILNLRISSERDLSDAYDMLDRQLKRTRTAWRHTASTSTSSACCWRSRIFR